MCILVLQAQIVSILLLCNLNLQHTSESNGLCRQLSVCMCVCLCVWLAGFPGGGVSNFKSCRAHLTLAQTLAPLRLTENPKSRVGTCFFLSSPVIPACFLKNDKVTVPASTPLSKAQEPSLKPPVPFRLSPQL
jgi:hypothetical protein